MESRDPKSSNQDAATQDWPRPTIDWSIFPWTRFPGFIRSTRVTNTRLWVWYHGYDIELAKTSTKRRWVCFHCIVKKVPNTPISYAHEGLQNAKTHLWEKHRIWEDDQKPPPTPINTHENKAGQLSITTLFGLNAHCPREQEIASNIVGGFNKDIFQQYLLSWIVNSNKSFRTLDDPFLKAAFEYAQPLVTKTSSFFTHWTLRNRLLSVYEATKSKVVETLAGAKGKIHVSFDGWRSRNCKHLYGVVVFWLDEEANLQKLVLEMPEVVGTHDGEGIADFLATTIESFGIQDKLGFFTLDNAGNVPFPLAPSRLMLTLS